jgi:hypothetical protein
VLTWVVTVSRYLRQALLHLSAADVSHNSLIFTDVHPLSPLPLANCSFRKPFVLFSIHFDGGYTPPHLRGTMNAKSANSSTINTEASPVAPQPQSPKRRPETGGRCQHRFPNGKRCRLYATDSHFGLCLNHFRASAAIGSLLSATPSDSLDLSSDLFPQLSEFDSAVDINQFLARLLVLLTQGRISTRRASVLAYISSQLLHSDCAIDRENLLTLGDSATPVVELDDMPRPDRSEPKRYEHPAWLASTSGTPEKQPS